MESDEPQPRAEAPLHPWLQEWFRRTEADRLTDGQIREARINYAALIHQLDRLVGRMLASAAELPGDTWVVYASDHGDMAGDRGMFWKRSMLEGAVRVPMIWHPLRQDAAPVKLARGRTVHAPVSLVDLAPTLTGLTGAPALPHQDGADLSGVLAQEMDESVLDALVARPVFAELAGAADSALRMVRKGRFKLVSYHGFEPEQLFDLERDPLEREDLSSDPRYREVYQDLRRHLKRDWNPEMILQTLAQRQREQNYMAAWGREVGMGRLDMWDERPHSGDENRA